MLMNEVIGLRTRGFAVICLGDFNAKIGPVPGLEENIPKLNNNTPLFLNFVKSLNLTILNTLPISKGVFSHFVEREGIPYSHSLLDYGLIDPVLAPLVTSFIVDSDARIDCGTDHALLLSSFQFSKGSVNVKTKVSDVLKLQLPSNKDFSVFDSHILAIS